MFSAVLKIPSKKSKIIFDSINPDIKTDKNNLIKVEVENDIITLRVKTKKINHLRSIIYSYLSMIKLLEEIE